MVFVKTLNQLSNYRAHDKDIAGNRQQEYTIGVFLDLAKAFDTVNHEILLTKLEHYGIRGIGLEWFKNYLTNRKQIVKYKQKKI